MLQQQSCSIQSKVNKSYGLVPSPTKSPFTNAVTVCSAQTLPIYYPPNTPCHLAFHDLRPTGPVCSDISSLPHRLGKWVDMMLQPIARKQISYFKDSFKLKALLQNITVPPGALLFTRDAKSMYTNIDIEPAL